MTASHQGATLIEEGVLRVSPPALLGSRCIDCGACRFPAAEVCARCQGVNVAPHALSARGTVHTFTIVHAPPPGYLGDAPYAMGVVELPEDRLRVTSTLTADDLDELSVGDRVELELITLEGGAEPVTSFAFRRTGAA